MDKKEYFLYIKGKTVKVSEEVYKAYWKITEHTNRRKKKNMRIKRHSLISMSTSVFTMTYREKKQES